MSDTSLQPAAGALALAGVAPALATRGFARGPISAAPGLPGGVSAVLNILNAQVIKAAPGILVRLCVVATGSGGSLTLNDAASIAGAAAGNEIVTIAYGSLSVGQMIEFNWPCGSGITISAVPSGSSQFSLSFT